MYCLGILASLVFNLIIVNSFTETHYKAAIYEHAAVQATNIITNKMEALLISTMNLNILEGQVHIAAKQGADIFVFPEYGITGLIWNRNMAYLFSDTYPNGSQNPTTNLQPGYVQARLGLIAKTYNIYLAINIIDRQPCETINDFNCPTDGHYLYNTDVVYNKSGSIIARYHKQHLFTVEKQDLDTPSTVEHSYFDTDFGRFGLIICFDAVFQDPAVSLVENYNVTDIIFSTAWMNVYPHYLSTAFHSGWANTMNVNYLAANLHDVPNRFVGSGIYGPHGVIDYTFNLNTTQGRLVVAEVPINRRKQQSTDNLPFKSIEPNPDATTFHSIVFDDNFTFVELSGKAGNESVCSNGVCCKVNFVRNNDSELYALGVFSGMHFLEGTYNFEICMVVLCIKNNRSQCIGQTNFTSTEFSSLSLQGEMLTHYAFPEVVNVDRDFKDKWDFVDYGTKKVIKIDQPAKLLSVILMGRNFALDPKKTL